MTAPSRRAAVIVNESTVTLGNFEPVLRAHGYEIDAIDARSGDFTGALDGAADAELVIVLGATCGVYEAAEHPFIEPELAFVRERLAAGAPLLGVCFGAQIIAEALGSPVRRGPVVDVGYRALRVTEAGAASPVRHVSDVRVAEWHGDTFDLPEGVTLLASSESYPNEAFGIGDWMLAVQFHPELTDEMHERWLADGTHYVEAAGYSPEALRAERERFGEPMQAASARLLGDYLSRLD